MIPTDQTAFDLDGNCMAACLASILEIPIEDVQCKETDNWFKDVNLWLQREHKLALMEIKRIPYWFQGYLIVSGKGPRGLEHACVLMMESFLSEADCMVEVVHDPHPSREGLPKITEIMALVKAD